MKKIKVILITLIVLLPLLFIQDVSAKTLGDLKKELTDLIAKDEANKNQQAQTEAEIAATKNKIATYQTNIIKGRNQIQQAKDDIEELGLEIKEKEEQTKELVRFLQIANGENSYLEYVFGATSMADLINRLAIVEQLSRYNKELITEMNDLIEQNEKLQKKLIKKEKDLKSQISSLEAAINSLGADLEGFGDVSISLENQIKAKRELIKYYEDNDCEDTEELSACVYIPVDTGFVRPIAYGTISSDYGWRSYSGGEFHYGTDIATGGSEGYKVYPVAAGRVNTVLRKTSCGGNIVFVDHIVNGKEYSSVYMHLKSVSVSVGDIVERDTVIGKSGGGSSTYGWDYCTTGAHLHLGLAEESYTNYSKWIANSFNPRSKIYFPSGVWHSRY